MTSNGPIRSLTDVMCSDHRRDNSAIVALSAPSARRWRHDLDYVALILRRLHSVSAKFALELILVDDLGRRLCTITGGR